MNNPISSFNNFPMILEGYRNALNILDASQTMTQEEALDILGARDRLHQELEAKSQTSFAEWMEVIKEDERLKQKAYKLVQVLDLAVYRESLPIDSEAWWWNLDSRESLHPYNRFDWLFRTIKLILLGVNFTLIGTIATRFLSGASGVWEIGGLVFSTFISLLQTQNALSKVRRKGFIKLMDKLNIPEHWYEEVQLGTTIVVFLILLGIWQNFSFFSELYKEKGYDYQEQQELVKAEQNYLKAIELDSDNLDAHYKLATLYEELQDFANAKKQYLIAAKGGYLDAYNNLAYWYIRENKNDEVVELLNQGLKILAKKESNFEQLTNTEKLNLQTQKYSLYKNLGWAILKQERNEDAIPFLRTAINIAKQPKYQPYIRNPGAAFCIYAQVWQNQENQSSQAKQYWQQCRQLIKSRLAAGETINPEEYRWLYEAKQQLQSQENG